MDIFDIEKNYFLLNLNESASIVNGYVELGEELFKKICEIKPILVEPGVYLRQINKYEPEADCFIGDISIMYYTYLPNSKFLETDGGFIINNEEEHLSKSMKLINCSITFYNETKNPLLIDKNYFMNVFSHEISHAFRYYSIISKNNGLKPSSVEKADELYKLSKTVHSDKKYYNDIFNMLKRIVYLSDKDETSAFVNQTYEYIKQNKNINKNNISEHFNEFRMFRETELLKALLVIFDELITRKKGKEACYGFLETIYCDRFKNDKAIKMFRQKIASIINYRIKKFTQVVNKALIDFNRNGENVKLEKDEMKLEELIKGLDIIL